MLNVVEKSGIIAIIVADDGDIIHFKELVQRGANLWPDAPPSIKEFADLVTGGEVLQDYYSQAKDQQKAKGN